MKKLILPGVLLLAASCSSHGGKTNEDVRFAVEQSHTLIKQGESVTFSARTTGADGRDQKIKWKADGGEIEALDRRDQNARVEYGAPGTYAVVASLFVDGQLVDEERAVVRVEPLY